MNMDDKGSLNTLNINSTLYKTRLSRKFEQRKPYVPAEPNKVISFIPGTILGILVTEGKMVRKGDELLILDAMKMQNRLKSPVDGLVLKINVKTGDKVPKGVVVIEIGE